MIEPPVPTPRGTRGTGRFVGLAVLLALTAMTGLASRADSSTGLCWSPSLRWSRENHSIDLGTEARYRWEYWNARAADSTDFSAFRLKLNGSYTWKNRARLFAEGQVSSFAGLESRATGAAGLYRASAGGSSETVVRLRQLYAEGRWAPVSWLRLGRQAINMGTVVRYEEPHWNFLKFKRLSQRLLGTVDWTEVARSYHSVTARIAPTAGHTLHAFVAQPTTGVFEIVDAYEPNDGILFGGFDWIIARGAALPDTEIGAFFLGYSDTRDASDVAGLFGDIELFTFGGSLVGVYPVGSGRLDVVLWGALQLGSYVDQTPSGVRELDQLAGAVVAETGYQLPEVWSAPWLRLGVNFATGDGRPDDGNRNTFFNILPTNHLYYGYADQLALSNLIDFLVQLKLAPLPKLGVEATFHQFWLHRVEDGRWFGTGAFSKSSLGYASSPSNGSHDVGQEIDLLLSYKLHRTLTVSGGFAKLFGGEVFDGFRGRDTDWAYIQVVFRY